MFNIPTLQAELSNIIEFGLRMADEVSGLPLLLQGERGNSPDTVGGMQMLMQSASIVLKRIAKQFDDYYTRPLLKTGTTGTCSTATSLKSGRLAD